MRATRWSLYGWAVVLGLVAGCSSAPAHDDHGARPTIDSSSAAHLPPVASDDEVPDHYGGSATSAHPAPVSAPEAVTESVAGVDSSVVLAARVGANPAGSRHGPWFYARVACDSAADGGCIAAEWQADLVQGATAERMAGNVGNLANVITGSTISGQLPDGQVTDLGGDQGDVAAGQIFANADETASAVEQSIASVLRRDGLTPVDIQVLKPYGCAPDVVVRMPADGMPAHETGSSVAQDIEGRPDRYEGLYLEIDAADGTPMGRLAMSSRSGAGRIWSDPSFGSMGVHHA